MLIFFNLILFTLAALSLHCGKQTFSSCSRQGLPLFWLTGFSLRWLRAQGGASISSCGTLASLLLGMWTLPRPGIEPVTPALAGGYLTTEPPGKPLSTHDKHCTKCFMTFVSSDTQSNLLSTFYPYFFRLKQNKHIES